MLIKTLVREGVQLALAVTLDCGAEALRWCEKGVGAGQGSCSGCLPICRLHCTAPAGSSGGHDRPGCLLLSRDEHNFSSTQLVLLCGLKDLI